MFLQRWAPALTVHAFNLLRKTPGHMLLSSITAGCSPRILVVHVSRTLAELWDE